MTVDHKNDTEGSTALTNQSELANQSENQANSEIATHWETVSGEIKAEIGDQAFVSWVKPMTVHEIINDRIQISVPTRFMRDWVSAHYIERLSDSWQRANPSIKGVDVFVQNTKVSNGSAFAKPAPEQNSSGLMAPPIQLSANVGLAEKTTGPGERRRLPMSNGLNADNADLVGASLDKCFRFEDFVVGKSNEFAYAASQRVAEATAVPFNPLFLYGGVGLGKTHLMHAIAWHLRQNRPEIRVAYLSAEQFMYRFVRALKERNTVDFKDQFRSVDVLMIDDVQFIAGKESTQEEFFHTFNALVDQGRQIVISADKSPSDLEGMEERLISRLNSGLVADIHATTYELRLGILQSKAERMAMEVPQKVMEFLAHRITANVRELEGGLNRVVAHSQLIGRDITIETTQEVLQDLLRANDRRVTIDEIQKRVSAHFNIRMSDMQSARRARSVARPRQVAMYLAKQLTARSLPEIGRKFGNRDHTTVMYAVKKVDELCEHDSSFAEDVELLKRMLEA